MPNPIISYLGALFSCKRILDLAIDLLSAFTQLTHSVSTHKVFIDLAKCVI